MAAKLERFPALQGLVCLFLYEGAFRFVFLVGLLAVPLLVLSILKVWTVTPKGFQPNIKISGLDVLQSWSLRRNAEREAAKGQFDQALYSWRIAIANNPGNPEMLRRCLEHLAERNDPKKYSAVVMGYSSWLLRLTRTNLADLEFSAKLYEQYRLHDLLLYVLAPQEDKLTPPLQASFLKALFNRGEISRFADGWARFQPDPVKARDAEIPLYQAAYLAGWGPHDTSAEGNRRLREAELNPLLRTTAHRLRLRVSEQRLEADEYKRSLDFLQEQRLDTLADHISYWELLSTLGRKSEATQLLQSSVQSPASGQEAVLLARACFGLGLTEQAREVLQRYAPEFGDSEFVWMSYANLLADQQRWDDLLQVALQLRHEAHPLRDYLRGYSFFLQGLAEAHRQRPEAAREAFEKVVSAAGRNKLWELSAADAISQLGFPDIAQKLLLGLEKDAPDSPEFWLLLAKSAYDTKDPQLLVSALASAYKLRPDDLMIINNFAAALLATRQQPERAVSLTDRVLQQSPESPAVKLNHCLALLQNQKPAEADALLKTIDPASLGESELASYHLAAFELSSQRRQFQQALQHAERIDLKQLFPTERQWLEKARQEARAQLGQNPAAL